MNTKFFGNKETFGILVSFFEDTHSTELSLFVEGRNILAFRRGSEILTTRWNLDELVLWIRDFMFNRSDDPFPINVAGKYAAEKDENARTFDSDDDEVFDAYYDKIDEWNERHRWHPASAGAILADVFFQCVGEKVEMSWNNTCLEYDDVSFLETIGGVSIPKEEFFSVMDEFLKEYADQWF